MLLFTDYKSTEHPPQRMTIQIVKVKWKAALKLIRSGMLNSSLLSVHNGEIIEFKYINDMQVQHKQNDEPHTWTVWEHKLHSQIYYGERIALLSIFCFVTIVAVLGNILTLYVVVTR